MNAIASKGYAHGVEQKECVVKRGSRIQVMGVMELLVGLHDDMHVSKGQPVSAQYSTKIGDQYKSLLFNEIFTHSIQMFILSLKLLSTVQVIRGKFQSFLLEDALPIRTVALAMIAICRKAVFVRSIVVGKHAAWLIPQKGA